MDNAAGMRAVLDALGEPAMITDATGRIHLANGPSSARFGHALQELPEICDGPQAAEALLTYLRRCAGVGQPLPGGATLRMADGRAGRFRLTCGVLKAPQSGARLLLLRVKPGIDEAFATLSARIRELNQEIRHRRHAQLRLEAALDERDLLLHELHHRVKNNIQLLTGILRAAQRESGGRKASMVLTDVAQRLQAVAAVHQILHLEGHLASIQSTEFIAKVAGLVLQAAGGTRDLVVEVQEIALSNEVAVPLALILNELLTNAAKHAARSEGQPLQIQIRLTRHADATMELVVADNGTGSLPGQTPMRRGSGLGLVHGLARQIEGALDIRQASGGGVECFIRFRDRKTFSSPRIGIRP